MSDKTTFQELVPAWARIAALLPRVLWKVAAVLVGCRWFVQALTSRRRHAIVDAINFACKCSVGRARWTFFLTLVHNAENTIYFAALHQFSDSALTKWARTHTSLENEEVLDSKEQSRPAILLLASFSLHYYGLLAPTALPAPVYIVQPSVALGPLNKLGYYERLSRVSGRFVRGICADTPFVAVEVGRAIHRGAIVAMRVDSLPTQTVQFVESRLCDRPSMFPLSILLLASRLNADLIPFSVIRRKGAFVTEFLRRIEVPANPTADDFTRVAIEIDAQITTVLRRHPEQYTAWHAVIEKWRMADEIRAMVSASEMEGAGS